LHTANWLCYDLSAACIDTGQTGYCEQWSKLNGPLHQLTLLEAELVDIQPSSHQTLPDNIACQTETLDGLKVEYGVNATMASEVLALAAEHFTTACMRDPRRHRARRHSQSSLKAAETGLRTKKCIVYYWSLVHNALVRAFWQLIG
jgi:hypothetical protein